MADKKVSELADAAALTGNELLLMVQNASSVKANLAALETFFAGHGKYSTTIGDGVSASFSVVHNLNTRNVHVTVYRNATPWDTIVCDVSRPDDVSVTLSGFGMSPSAAQFVVVVSR